MRDEVVAAVERCKVRCRRCMYSTGWPLIPPPDPSCAVCGGAGRALPPDVALVVAECERLAPMEAANQEYAADLCSLEGRVAELESENAALQAKLMTAAERIAAQSELLSKRAGKAGSAPPEGDHA